MLTLILAAAAALIVWSAVVLVSPIGRCGRCKGQRVIIRGRRSRRCPRCKGRGLCHRRGAVTVHRLVQNVAAERKRAANPPSRPPAAAGPPAPPAGRSRLFPRVSPLPSCPEVAPMPSFIRPARVDVIEDGGGLALIATAVAVAVVAVAVAAVVSFVLGHLALILAAAAVVGGGTLAAVLFLRRYVRPASARAAVPAMETTRALPPAPLRAIQRPARALPPAQHVHLHFHGLTAEDAAAAAAAARRELR